MLYLCVFHSNRFNTGTPACEGRHPDGQRRLPGEESRVVPLRRGFLYSFCNNPHQTLLAIERQAEPSAVARYNVERLLIW